MSPETLTAARPSETTARPASEPWVFARAAVERIEDVTPTFRRFALRPDEPGILADPGFDQRIKIVPPSPQGIDAMPTDPEWYAAWRALPEAERPPFRTYTVRGVDEGALLVDFALHGPDGPAARWATTAQLGDELLVLGPHAAHPGPHGGVDFVPPPHTDRLLIAGDETALPAIAGILERLPADARGEALIEMPLSGDRLDLAAPDGVTVRWYGRDGRAHGDLLIPAVRAAAARLLPGQAPASDVELEDVDIDAGLLWEVPVDASGAPLRTDAALYAWLAGEAAVIKTLRRHLVAECGVDRKSVAFMGYWRAGRSEGN
jgi:NADPH-dependent ferric siderophore reductase